MPNPFDIIRRAQDLQPLKASERAFTKLVGTVKPAVIAAVFTAVSTMILVQHNYDPRAILCAGGSAAFAAAYLAIEKYLSASTDPGAKKLGEAMQADQAPLFAQVNKALGYNDVKATVMPLTESDATLTRPAPLAPFTSSQPAPAPAPIETPAPAA